MKRRLAVIGSIVAAFTAAAIAAAGAVSTESPQADSGVQAELTADSWSEGRLTPLDADEVTGGDEDTYVPVEDPQSGEEAVLDTSMIDEGVAVAAGDDFVDLSWPSSTDAQYRIFRDDVLLTETTEPSLRDETVKPGLKYAYRVELSQTGAGDADADAPQVLGLLARVPASGQSVVEAAESSTVAAAASSKSAWVDARTFIPQARVSAPPATCEYDEHYEFGGDNRSYSSTSSKYRTRVLANLKFDKSDPRLSGSSASIGTSHVYRKSTGKLVATRTASSSGLSVRELGSDSDQVDLRFSIKASNPFCSYGAIAGAFTMNVYKNGNWAIRSGSHRQMPNWEIYAGWTGGPDTTVYKRGYRNAACLVELACEETQMGGYTGDF